MTCMNAARSNFRAMHILFFLKKWQTVLTSGIIIDAEDIIESILVEYPPVRARTVTRLTPEITVKL